MNKETPEQEAERLYPYEFSVEIEITDTQRSAHITCARQYMGEIEKLRAEIERWKDEYGAAILELREFENKHNL